MTNEFVGICESYGLKLHINTPTRITENTATCLDNIITNLDEEIQQVINLYSGISDHHCQIISLDEFHKSSDIHIINKRHF